MGLTSAVGCLGWVGVGLGFRAISDLNYYAARSLRVHDPMFAFAIAKIVPPKNYIQLVPQGVYAQ